MTIIAMTVNAQLVFNENFSGYTVNANLSGQNSWSNGGTTGTDVRVLNTTPLVYSGYQSGSEYVQTTTGSGTAPRKTFISAATLPTNTTGVIYMSFVVNVTSASTGNPGSGFQSVSLLTASGSTPARFYIDRNAGNTAVRFGVAVGSEAPAWTGGASTYSYNFNTTYLIVMQYNVANGNNNDDVYLWVNPSLSGVPNTASPDASHLSSNGEVSNGSTFTGLIFNQATSGGGYNTANAGFDAFRVSYGATPSIAWTNLAAASGSLPVTLTSFNADNDGVSTKLIWNVTQETNFASYVIEKSTDGRSFTAIGTVKATNQNTYSFTDGSNSDNNSYYRLKMVDIDGGFKYSYIVSIKSRLNANISLSPNPVKNNVMIQHPKVITEGHIQIFSSNGQLFKDVKLAPNAVITNIDMSGFTSGLYHIIFKSGSDMFNKTVIKQ
ncbi:hypothetical protein A4D02_12815 [Niastella koreensis]|nr:hypothetical protein A4D02_12815 [Niastella koreensis]